MINLKGAGGGGVDFQPAETYTITSDVATFDVIGLSEFRDLMVWGDVGVNGTSPTLLILGRETGGAWHTFYSGAVGNDSLSFLVHIRNFNGTSLIYPNKTKLVFASGGNLSGQPADVTDLTHISSKISNSIAFWNESWDELRFMTFDIFDGSDADAIYIAGSYGDT